MATINDTLIGKNVSFIYRDEIGHETTRVVNVERVWEGKDKKKFFCGTDIQRAGYRTFREERVQLVMCIHGAK